MKKLTILFISSLCIMHCELSQAQNPGEWMWIHGDNVTGSAGNYGVQGVPSPLNEPPALYETIEWRDLNGNFWMYGGVYGGTFCALWKYDPVTNEWTWMSGTQTTNYSGSYGIQGLTSPANSPPSRGWGAASWVDLNGDFWMFGGLNGGPYNDLWKYSVSINQWTWMSGSNTTGQTGIYGTIGVPAPGNCPGSRTEAAAAWTDNAGNLWMFGGMDWSNGGSFNDVWRYEISTNMWTWMKGSNFTNATGVYGTKGVEAANNTPGSRQVHGRWKDLSGNFWFFGGEKVSFNQFYNDLWRFNPVTNNWTWMSGNNAPNQPGFYGAKCAATPVSNPGARFENRATWTDQSGNLWMMGGYNSGLYNDLWKYCMASNEWIWIEGDSTLGNSGNWGALGISHPLNKPSARMGSVAWSDVSGKLYLFGGYSINAGLSINDMWVYSIDPSCGFCSANPIAIFSAPADICPGTCIDFTNNSINANSYLWNFPGGNPSVSTDAAPLNICYNTPGNYDVTLIASNANGSDTLLLSNYITVYPQPPPQGILQIGDTLFANQGASSYQWFYNGNIIPGATGYFYVATQSGDYNVVATDENDCEVEAVINNVLAHIPLDEGSLTLAIYPNPVIKTFDIRGLEKNSVDEIKIFNVFGEKVFSDVHWELRTGNWELLPAGLYILEIISDNKNYRAKFIKQ